MIKTILTAAVLVGTASAALATEADLTLFNRYPAYNMTVATPAPAQGSQLAMQSRNVSLSSGPAAVAAPPVNADQAGIGGARISFDRASGITGVN